MEKSLWYFSTWSFDKYEIKEAKVIKETEKQYIARIEGFYNFTVRKETMTNSEHLFFLTKEEAEQGLIKYLKDEIAFFKRDIKSKENAILKCKVILKEKFNIEEN